MTSFDHDSTTRTLAMGTLSALLALVATACTPSASANTDRAEASIAGSAASGTHSLELAFITHVDADLPEQDVFIERVPGSGEVFRVTKDDTDMSVPLYKTAVAIEHDPFDPRAVGPHPKGDPLGLTLGEWFQHQGGGRYSCVDGEGTLDAWFTGLVPDGVYTMWHAFTATPPTKPFSGALELPLGARDGSESVFTTDGEGDANFVHTFRPCLEMSDVWTTAMLAIHYHSDGRTHRAAPGDFGLNAHIPLFLILPNRDGL